MEEGDQIEYKGCLIERFEHPKLYGRYEVYRKEPFKFLGRAITMKEAKEIAKNSTKALDW